MSVLNLLFSNASGYTDAEVSVLFYGSGKELNARIVKSNAQVIGNKWYNFSEISAGVCIAKISGRI